jgi:site-specific DNA-methyltransferase (adenine-specific)
MLYQLHQQDCLEWMKAQPAESVDIILTSPPYNFDMPYGTYKDNITDYRSWTTAWITEGSRILKDSGRFIINIQPLYSERKPYHHWIYTSMEANQMLWYGERIWNKNTINGYRGAAGSMGIPSKIYLWYSTEYVQIFSKGDYYRPTKKEQSLISMTEQTAWAKDHIWNIAPARQKTHPAQMPKELALRCLKLFARKGDIVYDPFAGAGTTLLAAKELGLASIGCEIDPDYCQFIHERLK